MKYIKTDFYAFRIILWLWSFQRRPPSFHDDLVFLLTHSHHRMSISKQIIALMVFNIIFKENLTSIICKTILQIIYACKLDVRSSSEFHLFSNILIWLTFEIVSKFIDLILSQISRNISKAKSVETKLLPKWGKMILPLEFVFRMQTRLNLLQYLDF